MSPSDLAIFAAIVMAVCLLLFRKRKPKNSGCGGGCAGCPHSHSCPSQQKSNEK